MAIAPASVVDIRPDSLVSCTDNFATHCAKRQQNSVSLIVSECLGSRPAWPYLLARTAWCLGLSSLSFVFRLSLLSLFYSCAYRWVPVSFPFTCACWGIARWVLLLLLLFSSYSFRFFCQFGFPCDDVASCRLEFYKSRLSVCTTDISSEHSLRTCTQVRRNVRKSNVVYACKKKTRPKWPCLAFMIWLYGAEPSSRGGRNPCAHRCSCQRNQLTTLPLFL